MKKATRIILSIVYFVLTFALGFFLAFSLPINYFYTLTMEKIADSLDQNPGYAMSLLGGIYDPEPIYYNHEQGIVIFSAMTPVEKDDSITDYVAGSKVQQGYSIFFYKLSDYQTFNQSNNETKLKVYQEGKEYADIVTILDFDNDDNDTFDEVASKASYGFIYVELSKGKFNNIKQIELIDKDNNSYKIFDLSLKYDEKFFTNENVQGFYTAYNLDYSKNDILEEWMQKALADGYMKSSEDNVKAIQNEAGRKPVPYIIIYFVFIYLLWDTILGFKLLIKLFRLIFRKKKKDTIETASPVVVGDYYSRVNIVLNKDDVTSFDGTIIIKYSNEKEGEIEFVLNQGNTYIASNRVKAGVYQNPYVQIDKHYQLEGIPENLVVEGFHVDIDVKLKNIESSED